MEEELGITGRVQVSVPYVLLKGKYLERVVSSGIHPEIGLDFTFYSNRGPGEFEELARVLKTDGRRVTLHAPFTDLSPGSPDPRIRETSVERLFQALDLVEVFEPKAVVCHLGYSSRRYHDNFDEWLETSIASWSPVLDRAADLGVEVMFENVFEPGPEPLVKLLEGLDARNAAYCLDVGHARAFSSTGMREWLESLAPGLGMVHLHDNDGRWDHHWGLGMGDIDFDMVFAFLRDRGLAPIITLEPHREDWLGVSLEYLGRVWPRYFPKG